MTEQDRGHDREQDMRQRTEQRTEDRGQKTENRGQRTAQARTKASLEIYTKQRIVKHYDSIVTNYVS